ncbi:glycoside hydrolase [Luteibacter yeojuensis]|uniref:Glycoside hydrolase n=1 Tax=Luteibacter yeojuensis TaxID=345309 RepID=A0A7X5QUU3_9GAMM|nr:glycoside hydrolase [Luteibacter yeojuensis]NID15832.1 glycoside hydrolase [Luteibacter yeojuensis]
MSGPAPANPADTGHLTLARSTAPLNGPWRFHLGDDPRWSSPAYDDSAWETVDLTPAPGAHDGDVGLPGYVPGWSRRGHAGYTGYAWYRTIVSVDSTAEASLALTGPTLVDSTYQLYVDGKLLGGSGDFTGAIPTVFGVRPAVFPLPAASSATTRTYVIAFRVWMDPIDAGVDNGGIHVAPTIGDAASIDVLHQAQWLKTFNGYVADAVEPLAFVLLACMALAVSYRWLAAALVLLALLRINQVLFAWTDFFPLRWYDIATAVVLKPLNLAAWALAWREWFQVKRYPWLGRTVWALAAVYLVFAWLGRPWFPPASGDGFKGFANMIVEGVRWAYVAIYLWIVGTGALRSGKPSAWLTTLAAILVGIGLFATELNVLGIPGIWFPYGVGVARGQYAYAGFIVVLFLLILLRFRYLLVRDNSR